MPIPPGIGIAVSMAILPIYTYDRPILRRKLRSVADITDDIVALAASMHETMKNAEGIGLAANQVGRDLALLVVDISDVEGYDATEPLTLINPKVVTASDELDTAEEGCLSLPDLRADVTRPAQVQVAFVDLDMHEHTIEVDRLMARVIQHEIDHLNGIYFFDHLSPMRRALLKRRLMDIKRGDVETEYPLMRGEAS